MKVTQIPVEKIIPYILNNKIHLPAQVDKMAATIKEFGFLVPVLLTPDNVLIAGHKRLLAAKKLGMATVPAVYVADLSAAQIRALRIVDNKISQDSEFDITNIKLELDALMTEQFDLYQFVDLFDFGEDVEPENESEESSGGGAEIECPSCGFVFTK